MRPSLTFQIKPDLPEPLAPLAEIAANLWFSWHAEAVDLLQRVDHNLWREVKHNPVALLNQTSQERLEALAQDSGFLAQMERVAELMHAYLGATKCTFLNGRAPEGIQNRLLLGRVRSGRLPVALLRRPGQCSAATT